MQQNEVGEIKQHIKSIDRLVYRAAVYNSIDLMTWEAFDVIVKLMEKKKKLLIVLNKVNSVKKSFSEIELYIFESYFEKGLSTEVISKKLGISTRTLFRKLQNIKYKLKNVGGGLLW